MLTVEQTRDLADRLRGLTIAIIDKLNQLEALYNPLIHKAEAAESLAEVRACRVMAREYLGTLRRIEREAEQGGEGIPTPVDPHGGSRSGHDPGMASSSDSENFENAYARARS